jgi:hypothetical protein
MRDRPGRKELAMTSEQQGPTDEVLGHGNKIPDDDPGAGGDDRGRRNPDDTEGHGYYHGGQDLEAVDEDQGDDTEGHHRI